jgi:hypothetical protein
MKHAITGNIAFNDHGDRIESLYEIINIQHGQSKVVGTYRSNTVSMERKCRFYQIQYFFFVFFQSTCDTSSKCREIVSVENML